MSISITIADINSLTELEKEVLSLIGSQEEEELISCGFKEPPREEAASRDEIMVHNRAVASIFGWRLPTPRVSELARSTAPFIRAAPGKGFYYLDKEFLEEHLRPEEIKILEAGKTLKYMAMATTYDLNKRAREYNIKVGFHPSKGARKCHDGRIIQWPGSGKRLQYIVNTSDWKDSNPGLFYKLCDKPL